MIDGLTAENTALQFENARLTAELAAEKAKRGRGLRRRQKLWPLENTKTRMNMRNMLGMPR
ncbi:hypothetical protein QWZ10_08375 [Paracoccus cavernae]|uniref:Transposase n=1 Tax=Paracoccus cavernae TaxID=1571207 RepID=A0ABT8D7L6_9RHOB|nr:hypothetical protein [Paracoccus cavernae]